MPTEKLNYFTIQNNIIKIIRNAPNEFQKQ